MDLPSTQNGSKNQQLHAISTSKRPFRDNQSSVKQENDEDNKNGPINVLLHILRRHRRVGGKLEISKLADLNRAGQRSKNLEMRTSNRDNNNRLTDPFEIFLEPTDPNRGQMQF
ncbi:hypothetical protein A2U01_0023620 [Trifolium medium]|uniref:Uncharacterized protein n=1 Tax=Trifolium medium TaxID=97028 RepID=A0A392NRV8_9FABA|nr:hypothetical protein [Trifolium medium]